MGTSYAFPMNLVWDKGKISYHLRTIRMLPHSNMGGNVVYSFSMGLTALDIGDAYLTVIAEGDFETAVRKLNSLEEFWEVE